MEDRLLRTINAACAPEPSAVLTAQVWATMSVANVRLLPHLQVLELEVIGFLFP